MRTRTTTDAEEIIGLLEPLLVADPVSNTVLGSVVAGLRGDDAAGWCAHPVGNPRVLAIRSQLHTPIGLTAGWRDFDELAEQVARLPIVHELGGPVPEVSGLAAALTARGLVEVSRASLRLFRLDELAEPVDVAGSARLATADDIALLATWYEAFTVEAHGAIPPGFDAERDVTHGVSNSRTWLWTDGSGAPCTMAVGRFPSYGVARVGPVYTPPDRRGHGFGSAATAAATRDILDRQAIPVLYADLANPTSNKIYQRLGYRVVEDRLSVHFG
jgi:GNAT superfamily N-acetyltransferase